MGRVITLDGYAQRFKWVNAIAHFLDDGFKNQLITSTSSCNRVNPNPYFATSILIVVNAFRLR
ncbi:MULTISPECIES: hypothetical protein [Shewanella]|uniref:hypothetical protein n=1 Tax=Shewanella TaxID=22 RepID=UPI0014321C5D|nr:MULTISPECIES: hypothetical protein [Shewanella]MDC8851922.1 hypothetical protein [Shewanella algae]NJI83523.1 hypothetical protein [Shewanella sp. Iso12]